MERKVRQVHLNAALCYKDNSRHFVTSKVTFHSDSKILLDLLRKYRKKCEKTIFFNHRKKTVDRNMEEEKNQALAGIDPQFFVLGDLCLILFGQSISQWSGKYIRSTKKNFIPSGDRTQDLWIRSPTRYPLR